MNKKRFIGIALIVLIPLVIYYYFNKNEIRIIPKETVKIGTILPLTGNISFLGKAGKNGLEFAEYYFNEKIESKYHYEFIYEDGLGKPSNSISAYNKLTGSDKVNAVFSIISAVDLSLIPLQKKSEILFFSHSSHPALTNVDKYFYRHSNTVNQEANFISNFLGEFDNICLLSMNDEYGVAFSEALKEKLNFRMMPTIFFEKGETNFTTIATKSISSNPDLIIVCGAGGNMANLPIKLRELGFSGEIYTTLAYAASGAIKNSKSLKGLNMVNLLPFEPNSDFSQYMQEYEKQNNTKLGTFDIIFFNSAFILFTSMNQVGNDKESIVEYISSNSSFSVIGGNIMITKENNILPNLELIKQ